MCIFTFFFLYFSGRHRKYSCATISVNDVWSGVLREKLYQRTKTKQFVLNHIIIADSRTPDEQQDLKIFLSTHRLLSNLSLLKMIQIDAIYKLVWEGFSFPSSRHA